MKPIGSVVTLVLLLTIPLNAGDKTIQRETLSEYVARMQKQMPDLNPTTLGSLWNDNGRLVGVATDYKAVHVGDVISIIVAQDVSAQNNGNVATGRTFTANSGISALPIVDTTDMQNLFSPNSSATLSGKAQAATTSTLRTTLAGQVMAVLPNGTLVIEAERQVTMNNERQTLLIRGLVRPGDVAPNNTVLSNNVGNMEFELKGKGVLSDGTRPPNTVLRFILRLVGF